MLNRIGNKFHDDKHVEVHFVINGGDLSICGCDILGDTEYSGIGPTNKPVNCPDCLELIRECLAVKLKPSEKRVTRKKRKK